MGFWSGSSVELRTIQIIHILDNGTKITDHEEFTKNYQHLFNVNKQEIIDEIFRLRPKTDSWNKSVILIHQNGEFESIVNVHSDWIK